MLFWNGLSYPHYMESIKVKEKYMGLSIQPTMRENDQGKEEVIFLHNKTSILRDQSFTSGKIILVIEENTLPNTGQVYPL